MAGTAHAPGLLEAQAAAGVGWWRWWGFGGLNRLRSLWRRLRHVVWQVTGRGWRFGLAVEYVVPRSLLGKPWWWRLVAWRVGWRWGMVRRFVGITVVSWACGLAAGMVRSAAVAAATTATAAKVAAVPSWRLLVGAVQLAMFAFTFACRGDAGVGLVALLLLRTNCVRVAAWNSIWSRLAACCRATSWVGLRSTLLACSHTTPTRHATIAGIEY